MHKTTGLLSQNILSQLRNLVEAVSLKIYSGGNDIDFDYNNIKRYVEHIYSNGNLGFLRKFHKLLQASASHYTLDPENSERLMLKYYEYLLSIKSFMHDTYGMDILKNIDDFPIDTDSTLNEYYEKIAEAIDNQGTLRNVPTYNDRYYIQKTRPFFVNNRVYYEVTFTAARDNVSKFDRHVAFTSHDILPNYVVKLEMNNGSINVIGRDMPIRIIEKWSVSIRPCELSNFVRIFGRDTKFGSKNEINNLMQVLTGRCMNIVELIDLPQTAFMQIKETVKKGTRRLNFWPVIEQCRNMSLSKEAGYNVIRYLLYNLNNRIIKLQADRYGCQNLSGLYLLSGCKPFDEMPFNTSLIKHNPRLADLFECVGTEGREHELLARFIRNNTEMNGMLYTPEKEVPFEDTRELIQEYNSRLYPGHKPRRQIEGYKDYLYINEYDSDTFKIIKKFKEMSLSGVSEYTGSVDTWLRTNAYSIDCPEKEQALRTMFSDSSVALVYGSAGTGKSTLINHISNFFNDKKKIYIANTNPAADNLRRKVNAANSSFMTIAKFLMSKENSCDILFIDECSQVEKSVKIIITSEIEGLITHNIFYTAITRAKDRLKIYWTPETENIILKNLKYKFSKKDYDILKSKYPEIR